MSTVNHPGNRFGHSGIRPTIPSRPNATTPGRPGVVQPKPVLPSFGAALAEALSATQVDAEELAQAEAEQTLEGEAEVVLDEVTAAVLTEVVSILDQPQETVNTGEQESVETAYMQPEILVAGEIPTTVVVEDAAQPIEQPETVNVESESTETVVDSEPVETVIEESVTQLEDSKPIMNQDAKTPLKMEPNFFTTNVHLLVTLNTANDRFASLASQDPEVFESLKSVELTDKRTGLVKVFDLKNPFVRSSAKSGSAPGILRDCFVSIANLIATFNNKQVMLVGESLNVRQYIQAAVASLEAKLIDTIPVHLSQAIVVSESDETEDSLVMTLGDFVSIKVWPAFDGDLTEQVSIYVNLIVNAPVIYTSDQPDLLITKVANVLKGSIQSSGIDLQPYLVTTFSSIQLVTDPTTLAAFTALLEIPVEDPLAVDAEEEEEPETVNSWEAISYRDVQEGIHDWISSVDKVFPENSDLALYKALIVAD